MKSVTISLPWPPSVNHYYGRGRNGNVYLKEPGRLYRKRAAAEIARLGNPRLEGRVGVRLVATPPDNRRRDIDNIRKAVYDAISDRPGHRGVIRDDADIIEDAASLVTPGEAGVVVTIQEIHRGV